MRRSRVVAIAAVVVLSTLLSGCGNDEPKLRDQLIASVQKAQQQPHQFTLSLSTAEHQFVVTGLVEDDARYQASVTIDGQLSWEEVASDDTLADRFSNPTVLPEFLRTASAEAKASLPDIRSELAAGKWVLDAVGAPDLLSGATAAGEETGHPRQLGQDPILDGVTALEYVRTVLSTQQFRPYNKNDLDYDPAEDPFPKPDPDDPLKRYDSIRADLPTAAQIQGFGGRATLPDITNFRRMSIYVDEQGAVVRILERIDVASRLDELLSNAGLKLPRGASNEEAVSAVVDSLNKLRVAQGDEPIDVHELDLTLTDAAGQQVTLPPVATKGSLAVLVGRGQVAAADTAGAA